MPPEPMAPPRAMPPPLQGSKFALEGSKYPLQGSKTAMEGSTLQGAKKAEVREVVATVEVVEEAMVLPMVLLE